MRNLKYLVATFALLCSLATAQAESRISDETRAKLSRELPVFNLAVGDSVLIRTFKQESRLELWMKPQNKEEYVLFRTYPICYYSGGLGAKMYAGDRVTPEGFYTIEQDSLNPQSRYHLAMNIGFPNAFDRYHGRTGSLLMIHGSCDSVGCFAMGNLQIEEIYYLIENALNNGQYGVSVHAFPFHLTEENMAKFASYPWQDFWQQLKVGYDQFNREKMPPIIQIENGRYQVFSGNKAAMNITN